MSLKPWLSRRVPGIAKSTIAKLRGAGSSDLAVDKLPPMSDADLEFQVPDQLKLGEAECHPDHIPPLPAEDPTPLLPLADIAAVDQLDAKPTEAEAPIRPAEGSTPFLPPKGTAAVDQLEVAPPTREMPVSAEGPDPLFLPKIDTKPTEAEEPAVLADDPAFLQPFEDVASMDQLHSALPAIEESLPHAEESDPFLPPLDLLPADTPPKAELATPEFSEDDPPPPSENFIPANEAEDGLIPPPPLMPPVDASPMKPDGTQADAVRPQLAPKLLNVEERAAYMRAVNLFHRLMVIGNEGRSGAIHRLFDLVVAFPHGSSVRAIGEMLSSGYALHEIEDAAALKDYWRSDSSLWLHRSLRSLEIHSDCRHQTHLSWSAALALSSALGRDQALDALQGILLHEWINMSRDSISKSQYEFCYYHSFILKRSLEISEGAMNPILQIFEGTIYDDPVMPSYIWMRSSAPNFTGQPSERVFLPSIQNIDQYSPTFTQQAITKKKHELDEKGPVDAG